METVTLSEAAVAVLRFEIRGWKAKRKGARLAAYRELAADGIMEPVPGTEADYRFADQGYARREEILREEEDRIERQRYEPPDANLSEPAKALLRQIATGERVEITEGIGPRSASWREARIIYLMHTFTKGAQSGYRFTLLGWEQQFELIGCARRKRDRMGKAAATTSAEGPMWWLKTTTALQDGVTVMTF